MWKVLICIFLIVCCPLVSTFSKLFSSRVYLTSSYSLFLQVSLIKPHEKEIKDSKVEFPFGTWPLWLETMVFSSSLSGEWQEGGNMLLSFIDQFQYQGLSTTVNTFHIMEQGPCSSQLCSCHLRNEALVLPSLVVLENTAKLKPISKRTSLWWRERILSLSIALFWCLNWWKCDG